MSFNDSLVLLYCLCEVNIEFVEGKARKVLSHTMDYTAKRHVLANLVAVLT